MNIRTPDLTGRTGFRFSFFGRKLIAQVEWRKPHWSDSTGTFYCYWKDATLNEWVEATKMNESKVS